MYAENSGTSTESGKLIRINGIQYVVSYGDSYEAGKPDGTLTVTNKKLPQTKLTVQKIWQNMDGQPITNGHSETIHVYLMRFTEGNSGKSRKI